MGSPFAFGCFSGLLGHPIDLHTRQSAKLEVQSYSAAEIQRRILGVVFRLAWPCLVC